VHAAHVQQYNNITHSQTFFTNSASNQLALERGSGPNNETLIGLLMRFDCRRQAPFPKVSTLTTHHRHRLIIVINLVVQLWPHMILWTR
jgi:hypothetical protein